jgi:hypothetical protein
MTTAIRMKRVDKYKLSNSDFGSDDFLNDAVNARHIPKSTAPYIKLRAIIIPKNIANARIKQPMINPIIFLQKNYILFFVEIIVFECFVMNKKWKNTIYLLSKNYLFE